MKSLARSAVALAFLLVTLCGAGALTSSAIAADILDSIDRAGTLQLSETPKALGAGPYIGLGVGTDVHTFGDKDTLPVAIGIDGTVFSGRLGYDFTLRKHLLIGAFGDVNYSTTGAMGVDVDYSYQLGGRAGLRLGSTLVYGVGGGAWNDFSGVNYQPTGYFAGAGLQTDLGGGFSLALEGQREWTKDQDIEQEADKIRLWLLKKF